MSSKIVMFGKRSSLADGISPAVPSRTGFWWENPTTFVARVVETAKQDPHFSKLLVAELSKLAAANPEFGIHLRKGLRATSSGKARGPKQKWAYGRYVWLLFEYNQLMSEKKLTRSQILQHLSMIHNCSRIDNQITIARKLISQDELDFVITGPRIKQSQD